MTTELSIIENVNKMNPLEVFRPENVDDIIERIKAEAENFSADSTTSAGRDEIASFCYKIRRTKTAIDDLGKNLVADWKSKSKAVDVERKRMRDTLDALTADIYKPVQDYKDAEEARKQAHADRIRDIQMHSESVRTATVNLTSADLDFVTNAINKLFIGYDWEEFSESANKVYSNAMIVIDQAEILIRNREAQEAELKELRAKEAKRLALEEEQRKAEQEAERKRLAAEAEAAKEEARQATEKAEQERRERLKVEQAEADRKAKEEAETKAQEERERNTRHKGKINSEVREALYNLLIECPGNTEAAQKLVEAIARGKIPHVSIKY